MPHLSRRERVGDVDEAQTLRKPGKRNDGAAQALRGLMATAHRRLRTAVEIESGHLKCRDRQRHLLDGDVVDPGERRRGWAQLGDVLIRYDHDAAALERLRN